ncbi:glucosamine-6-phosphate deaminase [Chitinophaga eiseniae]|uniref:Glucosamine-6-phosphate deaminase n=1 Tax=Chitinophaga eiseniae TaxID=634771 RepID=A0A1T4U2R4_9BACT|nr:glucosamine-6-phosphate deaminase [Chitinophaga eiseniae]SKA46829.1 glucosamine-6-phosphate deaminase [Chitinophaga eiseniae]
MKIIRSNNPQELGVTAGQDAAALINQAIHEEGQANVILATGTSQFETLRELITADIDWSKVVMFHLDEYIGLPVTHPASFRKYLKERFLQEVSPLKAAYLIDGETDPEAEIARLAALIQAHPIDVALVGVGENGHLAFNDPPADFTTKAPYLVVNLDDACRQQQANEGWFATAADVPAQAISMSVHQIMLSKQIICSVPGERKARAVKNSLEQPVSNLFPASILQQHPHCTFYLDTAAAALLA